MNKFQEEKSKFRQRIFQHASMGLGLVVLGSCIVRYLFVPMNVLPFAFTVAMGISFVALGFYSRRRTRFTPFIAHGFLLTFALAIGLVSVVGRGFSSQILAALLILPVFSTFLLGTRAGALYTLLSIGIYAVVFWVDIDHIILYESVPLEVLKKSKILAFCATAAAAFAVSFAFDHSRGIMEQGLMDLNSSLEREKTRAEQSLAIKTRFLANMSHEIRTPMNGILGMTSLLRDSTADSKLLEKIEVIETSGKLLLGIIDDILDFSKLEAGHMSLERIPVQMPGLVSETVALMRTRAREKNISIVERMSEDLPAFVLGDPIRLKQILINLLGNAIKFSSDQTVDIEVSAREFEDDRLAVQVTVRDRGIGIDRASQEELFKPFSQADISTTRKFGGTGLGLALCKNFVELMGGRIWLESEEGKGSTFFFSFPTKTVTAEVRSLTPAAIPLIFPITILVAEDNQINRMVADGILRKIGYQADFAMTGAEALQAAIKKRYDIIFMDCHMPEMDGFEATQRIRKLPSKHRPLIVALTASVLKEERERCVQSGMDKFLPKPLQQKAIIALIDEYAKEHQLTSLVLPIAT